MSEAKHLYRDMSEAKHLYRDMSEAKHLYRDMSEAKHLYRDMSEAKTSLQRYKLKNAALAAFFNLYLSPYNQTISSSSL